MLEVCKDAEVRNRASLTSRDAQRPYPQQIMQQSRGSEEEHDREVCLVCSNWLQEEVDSTSEALLLSLMSG